MSKGTIKIPLYDYLKIYVAFLKTRSKLDVIVLFIHKHLYRRATRLGKAVAFPSLV